MRVPVVEPECNPGPVPAFPLLHFGVCHLETGDQVCLPPAEATQLWEYARDVARFGERVQVCTDTREVPKNFVVAYRGVNRAQRRAAVNTGVAKLVVDEMPEGVDVFLSWRECQGINGAYLPDFAVLYMCYEDADVPGLSEAIAAHEVAHAIFHQMNWPGVNEDNEERLADEYSAVYLGTHGYQANMLVEARWFMQLPDVEGDTHPQPIKRGLDMACWALGSMSSNHSETDDERTCKNEWTRLRAKWGTL